ncbi:hypothetical protein FBR05_14810 [Deltaproteobacteria bacterium PRO3]|nr:hypothetical protein [Deltaproteobacteria bacterium PRO3]
MRGIDGTGFKALPWPRAAAAELRALQAEDDPELLSRQLLNLGARLEAEGRLELAAELYAAVLGANLGPHSRREDEASGGFAPGQGGGGRPPTSLGPMAFGGAPGSPLQRRAQEHLEAISGRGALGPRAEFLLHRLTQEATDPVTLLALGAGSTAYSLTRLTVLGRLLQAPAAAWTRGGGARALASLAGFAVEAPAFTCVGRLGHQALDRLPPGGSWGRDLASSYLVLGGLKLAGWGGGAAYRRFATSVGAVRERPLQTLFQQGGLLTGILLGHALEERLGLRPPSSGATTLVDSLALLFQGQVASRLAGRVLGRELEMWNRSLDLRSRSGGPRPLGLETSPVPVGPPLPRASRPLETPIPHVYMSTTKGDGGGGPSRGPKSAPEGEGWLDKLFQALERHPHWLGLLRGPGQTPSPEAPAELDPYRRPGRPFASVAEARARSAALRRAALDSSLGPEFRSARLNELPDYLEVLRLDPEYGKALGALERLILRPEIPHPVVAGWPEVLLMREISLPEPVVEFYRQDRALRLTAADLYLRLQLQNPLGAPAIRRGAGFFTKAVEEPRLDRKFRTYFRDDVWSRAYFEAEAGLRKELLKRYVPFARRLPMGSEEARAGVRMLLSPSLLRLAQGRGPIPDYLTEPELILDMMRVYGHLLRLLPSTLPEVQRADRVLSPVLHSFGERAMAGEAGAVEILALFAKSDSSARKAMEVLAERGNPIARKLLAGEIPEG